MKSRVLFLALLSIFALSCKPIVICYENDVHCHTDGYERFAFICDSLRADAIVSAGDAMMGGPLGAASKGEWIVKFYNRIGYTAVAVGNHELDKGPAQLHKLCDLLNAPLMACNFERVDSGAFLTPYVIKNYGGVKVAFVGVLTPYAFASTTPRNFQDAEGNMLYTLHSENYAAKVQESVDAARSKGAKYVILLAHMGIDTTDGDATSYALIAATNGIDAVIDGHSHSYVPGEEVLNKDGKKVLLTQTGCYFENFGVMRIFPDGTITTEMIPASKKGGVKPEIKALNDSLKTVYDEGASRVIGKNEERLLAQVSDGAWITRSGECAIGNFVADAFRYSADAQVALFNGGGIRATLPAGTITYGDIFAVQPFGGSLCTATLTGSEITDILEYSVHAYPSNFGGFLHVSGLRFVFDAQKPTPCQRESNGDFECFTKGAARRVVKIEVQQKDGSWKPLRKDAKYNVAATSYLLKEAGNGYTMLKGHRYNDLGMSDVEVLENYIVNGLNGVIPASYTHLQGRITAK